MEKKAKLLIAFRNGVIKQNESLLLGQHGNQFARQTLKSVNTLFKDGDTGRDALCELLDDERPDVRAMAAAFLLRYRHKEAMAVLKEVAKMKGIAAFGANECIKRWEEGTWQLDPETK